MAAGESLESRNKVLGPSTTASGFAYAQGTAGWSSGGNMASGARLRKNRKLEMHYRRGLRRVTYPAGGDAPRDEAFMRALLGPEGGNDCPGFSAGPMDALRDLLYGLEDFAGDSLAGTGLIFKQHVLDVHAAGKLNRIERLGQRWPRAIEEAE
jgi:hypothetical protein